MKRVVKPLTTAAAAGLLVAALGIPGLALAAGTGPAMAKPAAQATMSTKSAKPMVKHAAKVVKHSARVKALQEALNKSGAMLHVDGIWGPKTHAALVKYQKSHSLKATGHLDKATRKSLKL